MIVQYILNSYAICENLNKGLKKYQISREVNNMNGRKIKLGAKYRYFKGNEYLVLHVAKHSETLEEYVVYQALYGDRGIWIRPLEMFLGMKEVDGKQVHRFVELE